MMNNMFSAINKLMNLHAIMRPSFVKEAPVIEKKEKSDDRDLMEVYAAMTQLIPENLN